MGTSALSQLEVLRRRQRGAEVACIWRAGCRESGPSGSGRGGWETSTGELAAYFIQPRSIRPAQLLGACSLVGRQGG